MTGLWEYIYEQLDGFDNRIIGAEFLPSLRDEWLSRSYSTQIIIHVLFGVGSIGAIDTRNRSNRIT
jgi:hypothetical protein